MSLRRALHFVFKIGNRNETVKFYRDILGMKVCIIDSSDYVMFSAKRGSIHSYAKKFFLKIVARGLFGPQLICYCKPLLVNCSCIKTVLILLVTLTKWPKQDDIEYLWFLSSFACLSIVAGKVLKAYNVCLGLELTCMALRYNLNIKECDALNPHYCARLQNLTFIYTMCRIILAFWLAVMYLRSTGRQMHRWYHYHFFRYKAI